MEFKVKEIWKHTENSEIPDCKQTGKNENQFFKYGYD